MQTRRAAWILSGLALVMMLFMIGMPAFGQYSLTNSTVITINNDTVGGGEAKNGYPSSVTVPATAAGNLEKVTVTINGFTHAYPNDVVLLLVAPNGFALPLMGNDGGGVSVNNLTLTFDDVGAGAGTLATATAITSGAYRTGDNATFGTTVKFPDPAPATNKLSLSAFVGLAPASYTGQWSLYVLDDSQPNTGSIASWSLNLYTQPAITVTNTSVTLNENQSTNFYFVASDTTSNATLTPTITLSSVVDGNIGYTNANGAYVDFISTNNAPADFQFSPANPGPNGTTTLTITPNANLYGTANFTVNLTDANGYTVSSQPISLTVTHVAVAPQIVLANSTITTANEVATPTNLISLVSQDGNAGGVLQFSVLATNGAGAGGVNLLNIGVNSNVFTSLDATLPQVVGRTNNFDFSIVPGGFPVGTSYLNFIATDPVAGLSTTTAVTVIVVPLTSGPGVGPLIAVNTNSLNVPHTGVAFPLSPISFTNLTKLGPIGNVTVSLLGLTNVIKAGLGLTLQAPDGTLVPLIAQPDSSLPQTYAEITFADTAGYPNVSVSNALPVSAAGAILTNYALNAFNGATALATALAGHSPTNTGANNQWTLWVTNSSTAEWGIAGGWVLAFYPAPLVSPAVPSVTMPESASSNVVFVTSDTLGVPSGTPTVTLNPAITPNYSDTALATATVLTTGSALVNGTNYTTNVVTLTGNPNETGSATVTLTVTETNGQSGAPGATFAGSSAITLNVTFVAQPPSISFVENQVTFAGDAILNVPFVVSSPDVDASSLTITVNSGNQGLLPTSPLQNNAVITRGPSTGTPPITVPVLGSPSVETNYLSLFPVGVKGGQSVLNILVSDGVNTVSNTFLLVVGQPGSPLYANATSISIPTANSVGSPYPTTNVVSGLVGTVENVVVTVFDVTEINNAAGLNLLLVGPTNATGQSSNVYLMGAAGGTSTLTSVNLIFSNSLSGPDSGAVPLPSGNSPIVSDNIYIPTNYTANAYTSAAPPSAPPPGATGYGTNLVSSFKGINPNGVWSLYAFDTNGTRGGLIFGGWQLSIITAPHISPATTNYTTLENVPTNIVIPVGDAEAGNISLTVTNYVTASGSSSSPSITIPNPVLVTNNGIANLAVLQVTPNLYQFGTNNILVSATDASGNSSTANLQLIVISNSLPPVLLITNVAFSTPAAVPISGIPFAVWDPQSTNANTISVSSTGLNPAPTIAVATNATINGTNTYSLTITPVGVSTGTALITVAVLDAAGQTAKTNISLTVTPNLAFISTNSITLGPGFPANELASSYPWGITVSNVGGLVSGVSVSLIGFNHNDASDVDVLLESPDGQHAVVLMANAGDQLPANNVNLQFSQTAVGVIPEFSALVSGTYLPTNYLSSLVFPAPATNAGYTENLTTAFAGVQPSGTWNLYVIDSAYPDSGSIASWILFLKTGPEIAAIPTYTVPENGTVSVPLTLTDFSTAVSNLVVTVTNNGTGLTTSSTPLAVTNLGFGTSSGVTNLLFTPEPNYPSIVQATNSTNIITVTVADQSGNTVSTNFTLIVLYEAQPPVVSASTDNLVIAENGSAQISFTVSDVDAYLAAANVNLITTDPALLVSSGIVTNSTISSALTPGTPGTVTYTITPVANTFGTNAGTLVFSVSNTNSETTTSNITLSVSHAVQLPTIAPFFAGTYDLFPGTSSTNIPFSVTTLESNATLTITGFSTSPSEVPNSSANIVIIPTTFTKAAPGTSMGTIALIIPSGTPPGSATIWVTNTQVVGGTTNAVAASFNIAVLASPITVFANTGPIANVATNGRGLPYPSTNYVTGLIGGVFSASVTLNALSADVPTDVSILLEAPNGTSVLLLSGAGGSASSANMTLTFADTNGLAPASTPLAANGGFASYHPTSYNGGANALPTNAPAPPYFDRLAVFNGFSGTNLNGTWSLWMVDNTTGDRASIANGWTLSIATAPLITLDTNPPPAQLVIPENAPGQNNKGTISFHVVDSTGGGSGDNVSVTSSPSSLFSSIVTSGPTLNNTWANDYTATLTPAVYATGSGTLTFTVSRTDGASDSVTYPVSITKSNIAPTLTRLGPIVTSENVSGQTEFFVTQLGDPLSTVTVAAFSGNQSVVADSGLTFEAGSTTSSFGLVTNTNAVNLSGFASTTVPNAGDLILNISPVLNAVGTAQISVYVTNADGAFNSPQVVTSNFSFTVNAATFTPTFANVPAGPVSVIGGNSTNIIFQVNSLDAVAPVVTVTGANLSAPNGVTVGTAVSSAGASQYNGTISNVAGSTWTVPISTTGPTSNQVKSTIQLTAIDANGKSTNISFQLITVPNEQHYYNNSNPINIVDVSPSIPSPSIINVSGLVGMISKVVVNVNGFGHQYPSDVGILLVGPNGSNTVLMNNAGSGIPVSGLTLTFSEDASGPAPASTQLLNNTSYLPSDDQPVKPYNFETSGIYNTPVYNAANPAPPNGPYPTNLNVFNGLNPNTNWYLYVQDDSAGDVGNITTGWTLQIFTQPLLEFTGLTNLTNAYPAGGKTSFVILDDSAVASANYTTNSFGVTSTNAALIPPANVTFVGSGTNWTVFFVPALNQAGSSLITLYATNSYGRIASASFYVTITPVNFPPVVFLPANGSVVTVPAGTPTTITLGYSDTGYNTNALVVSATSTPLGAQNPVPNSSLAFVGNGTGPSNLVVTPVGNLTGSNSVTVTVTQPVTGGSSASSTFTLVVVPSTVPLFVNTTNITIAANSPATPYPSQITVGGVGANILKVTATLIGYSHTFPSDVSALLVGPQGQSVMLMSDEGGGIGVLNARLTFDDAGTTMPASGPLTSGTYAPALSDLNFIDSLPDVILPGSPSNAPPNPRYFHNLSAFSNTWPNGVWSLYVYDNNQPDTGVISGGWALSIETIGPMITPLPPVTIAENTTITLPYSIASASTYASNITVTVSAGAEVPASLISSLVINGQGTSNQTLTITPTTNYPSAVTNIDGTAIVTLVLTDTNNNGSTNSFLLTVLNTEVPPTINLPVAQTNTPANVPLAVPFTISDVNVQGTSDLAVTASLSPILGTVDIITNGGGSYTLTFTPNGTLNQAIVSIIASDGTVSSTNTLQLTVTAGLAPTVTIVAATNTPENSTISVPFTLGYVPASFSATNVTGAALNPSVVSSVGITGSGSNFTANITLQSYVSGNSGITITAQDQFGTGTGSMLLTVTPVEYPPILEPIPDTNTMANTPVAVTLQVFAVVSITNLQYSAHISDTNVIASVNISSISGNEVATIIPAPNKTGVAAVTITVSDGVASVFQVFAVTVNAPTPPTLGPIAKQTTAENTPVQVSLNVTSPVTPLTNLTFSGSSTNAALVKSITFSFNGTNEVATVTPVANASGVGTVTISVSDGFSTNSQSFTLQVNANVAPTLSATLSLVNHVLKITFTGTPGASYGIQSSSNLKTWTTITTVTADASTGAAEYDATVTGAAAVFYRVESQ